MMMNMLSQRRFRRRRTATETITTPTTEAAVVVKTTTIETTTSKTKIYYCIFVFFILVPTITVVPTILLWSTTIGGVYMKTTNMVDVEHRIIQNEVLLATTTTKTATMDVQQGHETSHFITTTSIENNHSNNSITNNNTFESLTPSTTTDNDQNNNNNNTVTIQQQQKQQHSNLMLFLDEEDKKKMEDHDLLLFGQNIEYVTGYNGSDPKQWELFVSDFFTNQFCKTKLWKYSPGSLQRKQRSSRHQNQYQNHNQYQQQPNTLFIFTIPSCYDLFLHSGYGTGNYMMAIYSIRSLARVIGNIDIRITCTDGLERSKELVLPWITGTFYRTNTTTNTNTNTQSPPSSDPGAVVEDKQEAEQQQQQQQLSNNNIIRPPSYPNATVHEVCNSHTSAVGYMYHDIVFELRRMAILLVGIPQNYHHHNNNNSDNDNNDNHHPHPSKLWADQYLWPTTKTIIPPNHVRTEINHPYQYQKMQIPIPVPPLPTNVQHQHQQPLLPNIIFDDVVIHFRCGDLIEGTNLNLGFMKFKSYSQYISRSVRSIGILTQPFLTTITTTNTNTTTNTIQQQIREKEKEGPKRRLRKCESVVLAFVKHLRGIFYNKKNTKNKKNAVRITIHNGPNETIALAYARLVMANQSIIGVSSFSVFPVLATFGTGYINHINVYNSWLVHPKMNNNVTNILPNIHLINELQLSSMVVRKNWKPDHGKRIIQWMKNATQQTIEDYIDNNDTPTSTTKSTSTTINNGTTVLVVQPQQQQLLL